MKRYEDLIKQIELYGIIPVVKVENVEDALPLAKALCDGGLKVAEVTFRTECAKEVIRTMTNHFPDMLIGAGTVLTIKQVDEAIDAGAKFIVSPGLNKKVVKYCKEKEILILPGCATPSDMEKAIELGLEVVKFFPAEANGGLKAIKAMSAPYSSLRFMPTGGINPQNLKEYLNFEKIIACGGTWMVNDELVKNHDWQQITLLTQEAIKMMLNIRFHHVGIGGNQDNAKELASLLNDSTITNLKVSCCVEGVEYMYESDAGTLHHLCLSTTNIERAMFFLGAKGYTFDQSSIRYNSKGKIEFIYFNEQIGGCKVHLRLE